MRSDALFRLVVAFGLAVSISGCATSDSPQAGTPPQGNDSTRQTSSPPTTDHPSTTVVNPSSLPSPPPSQPDRSTTSSQPAVGPQTIADLLDLRRPVVLAHTGGEDQYPGGTLYGFNESVKAGVDILDFNVLLTSDGQLVVQHDLTVDRTTNATGPVAALSYDQLFQLDNAFWFTTACTCVDRPVDEYVWRGVRTGQTAPPAGYTADDFAAPSLASVVARFPDALLGIEIKGQGEQALAVARALAAELVRLDRVSATTVSSFDDAALAEFHTILPQVPLSPGLQATSAWVLGRTPLPQGYSILQLPPEFNGVALLSAQLIADSHAAGYLIWVWPNNRDLENALAYRTFLDMGLDGLNINFPADGVETVRQFLYLGD